MRSSRRELGPPVVLRLHVNKLTFPEAKLERVSFSEAKKVLS